MGKPTKDGYYRFLEDSLDPIGGPDDAWTIIRVDGDEYFEIDIDQGIPWERQKPDGKLADKKGIFKGPYKNIKEMKIEKD